jgi:hypothetical protein
LFWNFEHEPEAPAVFADASLALGGSKWTIRWTVSETAHWKRTGEELEIR